MDKKHITQLLERYWEGTTTLEEDKQIRSYFASGEMDQEHEPLADYFLGLDKTVWQASYTGRSREELLAIAENIPTDTDSKVVQLKRTTYYFRAIAAAFVLVVGAWFITSQMNQTSPNYQASTVETPEEALEQTKVALAFLSSKMKKVKNSSSDLNHIKTLNQAIPNNI